MRSVALLAALGVLTLLATYVVVDHFHQSELLAPVVLLPLLAAILLGRRVAVFLAFLGPVVLVSLRGFGPEFLVAATVAGVAAVLVSENLKHRHDLYVPVLVISGIDVLTIVTLGLAGRAPIAEILGKSLDGVLSSALVGVLASALLPIFEKSFRITTNFTLIELLDRNHPLLKRMAMEAPGTFHHSMLVSELAREAAEVVGGNPLLAQVGAYYHDIGKMQMPEYFIENQSGKNRHDNLTPTMSCLILGAHVRDGIQMAREAGLPREIIAFIPEHHGTNLMSYFYHKAMDRDPNLEQQDFRYPGPEPHRKETAIVMLADSVEATARSIEDPTPGRIRSVVKRIIEHRAGDGQLDHSGLTLADLARVRDTFINVLDRFFHGRIQYPEAALRIRRPENGGRAAGPQGEEIPGRAGEGRGGEIRGGETRRPLRRGIQLPDGTESVVIARREEGEDASPGGGPAAPAPGGEERAQDDRPGHARGR
jgi:putative nucleotidyltransferase with HDIG domain